MSDLLTFEVWHYYLTIYANRININVEHLDGWKKDFENGMSAFESLSTEYPNETKNFHFQEDDYLIAIWEQTMAYNQFFQKVKRKHHIVLKGSNYGICSKKSNIDYTSESDNNHGLYSYGNISELKLLRKTTNYIGFSFCQKCLNKIDKLSFNQ